MIQLGVNIDHVATVRQARRTPYPDVIAAGRAAERGGADAITVHLREDRRHIQDEDVVALKEVLETRLNMEMAVTAEMISVARNVRPADVCLVPERREELTTEGGLDVAGALDRIRDAVAALHSAGVRVSLFIDPEERQIEAAARAGARVIELHTGAYAEATEGSARAEQLRRFRAAAKEAAERGLAVNAGHGLTLENVDPIASCPPVRELNIGHSIVARALFVGIEAATREMKERMLAARRTAAGGGKCS